MVGQDYRRLIMSYCTMYALYPSIMSFFSSVEMKLVKFIFYTYMYEGHTVQCTYNLFNLYVQVVIYNKLIGNFLHSMPDFWTRIVGVQYRALIKKYKRAKQCTKVFKITVE
jgi:hypothetical protein